MDFDFEIGDKVVVYRGIKIPKGLEGRIQTVSAIHNPYSKTSPLEYRISLDCSHLLGLSHKVIWVNAKNVKSLEKSS